MNWIKIEQILNLAASNSKKSGHNYIQDTFCLWFFYGKE